MITHRSSWPQTGSLLAMTARKNHYVSQCYLKGFAKPRKKKHQVFVVDAQGRKSFYSPTDGVAAERDFNRVEIVGYAPDAIENDLSKFESELAEALQRIIAARSIADENDRIFLLSLVCLLTVRNPRLREAMRNYQEQGIQQVMNLTLATQERRKSHVRQATKAGYISEGSDTDYEKMKKFVAEGQYRIDVPTTRHVMQELESADKILPYLVERK